MTDLWKNLRLFLVELVVYACFITAYFFLALDKLGNWLKHVFDSNIDLYAILALALITVQGVALERFTTWLLHVIERTQGIALVFRRLARPHETVTAPQEVRGLLVYRFAGPLLFFNASHFARRIQELIDRAKPPVTVLLINAEAIIDMDAYAVETLAGLHDSLSSQGIGFGICGAKGHFLEVLQRARSDEGLKLMVYQSVAVAIKQMAKKTE
jgi:MFS superfamily sulfate permease-like transporter